MAKLLSHSSLSWGSNFELGPITRGLSLARSFDTLKGCVLQPYSWPYRHGPTRAPSPPTSAVCSASSSEDRARALHPWKKPHMGALELPRQPQTRLLYSREVQRELRSLQRTRPAEPRPPWTEIQEGKASSPAPWAGMSWAQAGSRDAGGKVTGGSPTGGKTQKENTWNTSQSAWSWAGEGQRQAFGLSDVDFQDRLWGISLHSQQTTCVRCIVGSQPMQAPGSDHRTASAKNAANPAKQLAVLSQFS